MEGEGMVEAVEIYWTKMDDMNEVLGEVNESLKYLTRECPEKMKAFGSFMYLAEKEGALSHKTKELMSIALSIATHCKWCIAYHTKNALDAGASRDEILETCFVAAFRQAGLEAMSR